MPLESVRVPGNEPSLNWLVVLWVAPKDSELVAPHDLAVVNCAGPDGWSIPACAGETVS